MSEKKSALESQVGGSHYKTLTIQPVQLAYSIGGSPCFCKLTKYITRDKGDRKENLAKALHVIELENELIDYRIKLYPCPELIYDEPEITRFAAQFGDLSESYQYILNNFFLGFYAKSAKAVLELMKKEVTTNTSYEG